MKKTKVENISSIKLDFFLRQNKEDIRVVLMPGETTWCDHGTTTKSMILYERKSLIRSYESLDQIESIEVLDELHTTEDIQVLTFDLVASTATPIDTLSLLVKTEEEKTYKGKKRGRKKKRGPKPGAKKKKLKEQKNIESNDDIKGV